MHTLRSAATAALVVLCGSGPGLAAGPASAAASRPSMPSAAHAAASAPASAASRGTAPSASTKAAAKKPEPAKPPIDINTASRAQLKTLPGIGDAEADRIIAGRPYQTKTDLVSTKAIPAGTYVSIKRLIVALPPKKRGAKG